MLLTMYDKEVALKLAMTKILRTRKCI